MSETGDVLGRVLRLTADAEPAEVVRGVAHLVTAATGADACFVHLVDRDADRLVLAGATPPFDTHVGEISLAVGEGVAGWVAAHGEPTVVPDKWRDPRYRYLPELRGEDYAALVSVPMTGPSGRVVGVLNVHARRPDGVGAAAVPLLEQVGALVALAVEHAALARRLAERERVLEAFAKDTIDAHERERRRLAGDIHDGISQRLLSVWYHLQAAETGAGDPVAVRTTTERARTLVVEALEEARMAIAGLRPTVLDDLGLAAALESLARSLPGVDVATEVEAAALAAHVELAMFRIAQEALQNVAKHARARHAWLSLRPTNAGVVLRVADDGEGFAPGGGRDGAFGFTGMHERADLIGATLTVRSEPGEGTIVELIVPVAGHAAAAVSSPEV
ncbi:MAG: GAF domain-containing sensor histidine kinase [Acidimicrobiales bacterium]